VAWTKPRQKNIPVKEILRLKRGSIPTKLLNVQIKQKNTYENYDNKRMKIPYFSIERNVEKNVQHK